MPASLKIAGAKEMEALLRQLPEEPSRKVVRGALMAGAAVIQKEAERTAPVGRYGPGGTRATPTARREKVGALKDNIKKSVQRVAGASMTVAVGIGAAFWGLFDEFGTRHQAAHPWFRRAFEASKGAAVVKIGQTLAKGIETEALRLAGTLRTKKTR